MWNYLLYKKQELERNGRMEAEFCRLFGMLKKQGVVVAAVEGETIPSYMTSRGIPPDAALVIAALDETLEELSALPVASIGYRRAEFASEGLYGADMLAEGFEEVDYLFLERVYQRRHGIPWRILETRRCYVREMQLSDLPDLYRLYEGPGMTDYIEPLYAWEEEVEYTKAYIEHMYRYYGYGMWLVKDRRTDELIGRVGFNPLEFQGEQLLELGYVIAVSRQRMGYAEEVCRALLSYASKEDLGFQKIDCFVQKGNDASVALLQKLGFCFRGICRRDKKQMLRYDYLLQSS